MRQLLAPPSIARSASTVLLARDNGPLDHRPVFVAHDSHLALRLEIVERSRRGKVGGHQHRGPGGIDRGERNASGFGAAVEPQIVERIEQPALDHGGERLGQSLPRGEVFERSLESAGAAIARAVGQRERPGEIEIDRIGAERRERARDLELEVR